MTLLILILLGFAPSQLIHAETPTPICIAQLTKKPYVSLESAQDLCLTYPYPALGCAMDLVDMQYSSNYFDALEYCLAPSGRP